MLGDRRLLIERGVSAAVVVQHGERQLGDRRLQGVTDLLREFFGGNLAVCGGPGGAVGVSEV